MTAEVPPGGGVEKGGGRKVEALARERAGHARAGVWRVQQRRVAWVRATHKSHAARMYCFTPSQYLNTHKNLGTLNKQAGLTDGGHAAHVLVNKRRRLAGLQPPRRRVKHPRKVLALLLRHLQLEQEGS